MFFTPISVYTDWRSGERTPKEVEQPVFAFEDTEQAVPLPTDEELTSMPPVLRVIYLLKCFISEKNLIPALHNNTSLNDNGIPQTPKSNEAGKQAGSTSVTTGTFRVFTDPIMLQYVLENLTYLVHIGDCLHAALVTAETRMHKITPPAISVVRGSNSFAKMTAGGSQQPPIAGSQMTATASPDKQIRFIHYINHCHLMPR